MITPSPKGYVADATREYRYEIAPLGQKVLLLTRGGVCVEGIWYGHYGQHFWGWCPLPRRNKRREEELGLSHGLTSTHPDHKEEDR